MQGGMRQVVAEKPSDDLDGRHGRCFKRKCAGGLAWIFSGGGVAAEVRRGRPGRAGVRAAEARTEGATATTSGASSPRRAPAHSRPSTGVQPGAPSRRTVAGAVSRAVRKREPPDGGTAWSGTRRRGTPPLSVKRRGHSMMISPFWKRSGVPTRLASDNTQRR